MLKKNLITSSLASLLLLTNNISAKSAPPPELITSTSNCSFKKFDFHVVNKLAETFDPVTGALKILKDGTSIVS